MMEGSAENDDGKGYSFWKKNSTNVPGRPSPKKELKTNRTRQFSAASYQDFQASVNDAWEIEDDEFEVKISKHVAQAAALRVINAHRSNSENTKVRSDDSIKNDRGISESRKTEVVQPLKRDLPSPSHKIVTYRNESSFSPKHVPGRPHLIGNQGNSRILQLKIDEKDEAKSKLEKFETLLTTPLLNLDDLRQLSWSGIPVKVRPITWRLLSGYLPASLERRQQVLERKRLDYWNLVKQYFDTDRDEIYQDTFRQIHIDVPRMSPLIPLFQQKAVQEMFERILFIWAIRHPASGYVQGINDLLTPYYIVFLQEVAPKGPLNQWEITSLSKEQRDIVEADSFWCLSKFLDGIQDNYIFAQTGIQQKVNQLKELIQRIDGTLHRHLQVHEVDYLQFSFRWMNNLLTRELPLHCSIRLWDTYLAESNEFATFQLYVCASFLLHFRAQLLLERDFQGLMLMLQNLPTQNWHDSDVSMIVAEAYRLQFTFAGAPNHLQSVSKGES